MNEQVIVILEGGTLGPFDSKEQAAAYLGSLDIKGQIVPLTAPPSMSDQLAWALTHIRLDGENLEGFLKRHKSEAPEQVLRDAFAKAILLNRLAIVSEDFLTDEQLAIRLYKQLDNNKIATINQLRIRRLLGLRDARDTVLRALELDASGLL